MKKISDNVSDLLCHQGILKKEDKDICSYGLEVFLSSMLEISSIIILSYFIGNFTETVFFFLTFIPLRIYSGGYHADTKIGCYLISIGVYAMFTIILHILPNKLFLTISLSSTILSILVVLMLSPVIHKNKNVNSIELKKYRKQSIKICIIESAVILLLMNTHLKNTFVISLSLGQVSVVLSMIAADIKIKFFKTNEVI